MILPLTSLLLIRNFDRSLQVGWCLVPPSPFHSLLLLFDHAHLDAVCLHRPFARSARRLRRLEWTRVGKATSQRRISFPSSLSMHLHLQPSQQRDQPGKRPVLAPRVGVTIRPPLGMPRHGVLHDHV